MPAPQNQASAKVFGRKNGFIVAAIAGAAGPTVAEMTATTTFDATDTLFSEGTDKPTQNTNLVERIRRWGQTKVFQQVGITQYTGGSVTYAIQPQAAAASAGKKLYERIPEGTTAWWVERLDVAKNTDVATGQFVNAYPIEFGPSQITSIGEGENEEAAAVATFAITGDPRMGVPIVT